MGYRHEMKDEQKPRAKDAVFTPGKYTFEVVSVAEAKSKLGNDMFIIELAEEITLGRLTCYAVSTPGKRWMLKHFLAACKVSAAADGVYDWSIEEVIGRKVGVNVLNEWNEFINRNGEAVKNEQSKVEDFFVIE